ncbi:MAG: segregation and condensation protein A [Cellvibrionaceae bacterium]|jgi:segregation and condensation protein A
MIESTAISDHAKVVPTTTEHAGEESAGKPAQGKTPLALIYGQALTELPKDLYIPPDSLKVILEAFEGPLDLLLYLIRRQNLDILNINVAEVTHQYVIYVEMMDAMQFELAAEYLVMAAMLTEIKSRMLLPRREENDDDEEDPRVALMRRIQDYERFKQAAEDIDAMPRLHRNIHEACVHTPDQQLSRPEPDLELKEILLALSEILKRADMFEKHRVQREQLSTRERMTQILETLNQKKTFVPFISLFRFKEGRMGVIVTFLAVMELVKESLINMVQSEPFGPIHIKSCSE